MRTPDFDIANFLSAYNVTDVKKGIKLWALQHLVNKAGMLRKLAGDGWDQVGTRPEGREYINFDGKYWVQSKEAQERMLRDQRMREQELKARNHKRSYGTPIDPIGTELLCPICGGSLFKESLCPRCKEGKQGYRVRLICGEDADHEFLV